MKTKLFVVSVSRQYWVVGRGCHLMGLRWHQGLVGVTIGRHCAAELTAALARSKCHSYYRLTLRDYLG